MTLLVNDQGAVRHILLNRPTRRNAMNREMVTALGDAFRGFTGRAIVLRGAGGHFCAGGDVADMASATSEEDIYELNRAYGQLLQRVQTSPAVVIAWCEGTVMGGGLGLACVADLTLAVDGAKFRMPEVRLGITPAQIAPFVVRRVGLTQARALALTGGTWNARDAVQRGVAQHFAAGPEAAEEQIASWLAQINQCEPGALAATKGLLLDADKELSPLLDRAARDFARRTRSPEAAAGFQAFMSKTSPPWAEGT